MCVEGTTLCINCGIRFLRKLEQGFLPNHCIICSPMLPKIENQPRNKYFTLDFMKYPLLWLVMILGFCLNSYTFHSMKNTIERQSTTIQTQNELLSKRLRETCNYSIYYDDETTDDICYDD